MKQLQDLLINKDAKHKKDVRDMLVFMFELMIANYHKLCK